MSSRLSACVREPWRMVAACWLAALVTAGCAASGATVAPSADDAAPATIYIVGHGLHAGLVIGRADLAAGLMPEAADFPDARYLEIGWGDREYYMAPDPSLWVGLKAVLVPTPSALHVVGFDTPVDAYFPASTIVELRLSAAAMDRLARRIDASFERGAGSRAAPLGPGQYGDSRFYPSHEKFHLLMTCNAWLAHVLRAAGIDVSPRPAMTAGALIEQLRRHGRVIRP